MVPMVTPSVSQSTSFKQAEVLEIEQTGQQENAQQAVSLGKVMGFGMMGGRMTWEAEAKAGEGC